MADDTDGVLLEASAGLAAVYRSIAEKYGLYFADTAGWRIHMTYDEVHFSPAGHAAFAMEMDRLLRKILEI
jgi:lysophospholipase L1-like esterase